MMDFKLKGGAGMIRSLKQIDLQEHSRVKLLFEKTAAKIEKDAKARAPVDRTPGHQGGTLRRSITHRVTSTPMSIEAKIGTDIHYAPYQEEGTSRGIPAIHYLRDAYRANIGPFLAELTSIIHSLRW